MNLSCGKYQFIYTIKTNALFIEKEICLLEREKLHLNPPLGSMVLDTAAADDQTNSADVVHNSIIPDHTPTHSPDYSVLRTRHIASLLVAVHAS